MSKEIKCSKVNPCQSCKNELQEKLKDCKNWEVKRKEYIKSWFPFHDEEGNKVKYSETGGYNICSCGFEISNSHGDINTDKHNCSNNKNDDQQRERERERERESILNYFKQHNIKSAKLEGDKLIIEYNNSTTESKEINNSELQQTKSYLQKLGKQELSLSDLEQSSNHSNPPEKSNKGLYIGLVVLGVVAAIVFIVYLVNKNNKNKE